MKKKWMYYAACGLALFGLAACSSNESADDSSSDKGDGGSLVVYSPNSEGLIGATIPAFEEKYGIKVELIQAGTGELFKKLESEKEAPVADVIFVVLTHNMLPTENSLKTILQKKMIMLSKNIKTQLATLHLIH